MKKIKRIGIWGFGSTGKAAANYFHHHGFQLQVMDSRELSGNEKGFFDQYKISYVDEKDKLSFFSSNDFLFVSSGVDIRNYYATYKKKWLNELDLFYQNFNKPIIAVTGSVGKTSVVHILSHILRQYDLNVCTGGNIGIPTFELLMQKQKVDIGLLEVSSFQLEYVKKFAPDIAVWTNFYPNHLDRHGSINDYFKAKLQLIVHQTAQQKTLLPLNLLRVVKQYGLETKNYSFFSHHRPNTRQLLFLKPNNSLFFLDCSTVIKYKNGVYKPLLDTAYLLPITFSENWLIISSILKILELPLSLLPKFAKQLSIPNHRLEKVACVNNIDFYNDSKSTTPASTYAAVQKLRSRPIFLFLGGLSKNIDRAPLIKVLKNNVVYIACFGAEGPFLHSLCIKYSIASDSYPTHESAFFGIVKKIIPGSVVLFSPAGSSFDLFMNYQERGNYFKKLVKNYRVNQKT